MPFLTRHLTSSLIPVQRPKQWLLFSQTKLCSLTECSTDRQISSNAKESLNLYICNLTRPGRLPRQRNTCQTTKKRCQVDARALIVFFFRFVCITSEAWILRKMEKCVREPRMSMIKAEITARHQHTAPSRESMGITTDPVRVSHA